MKPFRFLGPSIVLLFAGALAVLGQHGVMSAHQQNKVPPHQERSGADQAKDPDQVWSELVTRRQNSPTSPESLRAGQLLFRARSPLDSLPASKIPASERFPWQPRGLVALLGQHRGRHWGQLVTPGRNGMTGVVVSSDGKRIASCGAVDGVRLWDATSLRLIATFPRSVAPAFSPDGKTLAVAERPDLVRLFDISGAAPTEKMAVRKLGYCVSSVAFAPGGKGLAVSYREGFGPFDQPPPKCYDVVALWDWQQKKPQQRELPRIANAKRGTFTADGQRVVHATMNEVHIWGVGKDNWGRHHRLQGIQNGCFALSPDGKTMVTTLDGETLTVWSIGDFPPKEMARMNRYGAAALQFSRDGQFLAGIFHDCLVIWSFADVQNRIERKEPLRAPRVVRLPFRPSELAFAPNGQIVFGSEDGSVRLWHLEKGQELFASEGHCGEILALAFSPDGKRLATAGKDNTLRVWNLSGLKAGAQFVHHFSVAEDQKGLDLSFSPDGQRLACLEQRDCKQSVRLWDVSGGTPVPGIAHSVDRFDGSRLIFDPTGFHLVLVGRRWMEEDDDSRRECMVVWRVGPTPTAIQLEKRYPLGSFHSPGNMQNAWGTAFTPDGKQLAVIVSEDLRLWNWARREAKEQTWPRLHASYWSIAFTLDGKEALTCGINDGEGVEAGASKSRVRCWAIEGSRFKQKVSFVAEDISQIAYALGEECVLTGEKQWDYVLRDKTTAKELWNWTPPGDRSRFAVAPDGRHVALGNANGTIYIVRLKELPKR